MPPRRRTKPENRALPQRWEWRGNRIYYQIPPALAGHAAFGGRKRCIPLGSTLSEAHKTWSEIMALFDAPVTDRIPSIAEGYIREELPYLALKTQRDYRAAIARIAGAFQEFRGGEIRPGHCYDYVDANLHRVRAARYEIRVLSSMLTWAVSKHILPENQLIGQVRFNHKRFNPPVKRAYIMDADLEIFYSVIPRKWQLYVLLKLKTNQSQQTLLTTKRQHVTDEGLDFNRAKTQKDIPMAWDDELRAIVKEILELPTKVASMYLFPNRWGECYYKEGADASGFQSMWQRYQAKAMKNGMSRKFGEHQLRHKTTSDNDLQAASDAAGHADLRITKQVYQVRPPAAKPLGIKSGVISKKQ